jgi:hypothetical protein
MRIVVPVDGSRSGVDANALAGLPPSLRRRPNSDRLASLPSSRCRGYDFLWTD